MHLTAILFVVLLLSSVGRTDAQLQLFDTTTTTAYGDTARFLVQIPSDYDPSRPPAILVGWHALGGSRFEIFAREYDEICEQRGWIIASHEGPNDRHWNTELPQLHCRSMLEWIETNYPFSRDSIYMCGGSMGAAAGQVWHNNNCSYDDYFIAATAGGSQILDCQLRQEQYLAIPDTNRSMRVAFGGFPFESDSIAYEYHRYSAVFFEDTSESMHFNCLTIPVWSNWGAEQFEWDAYGYAAQNYAILRQGWAESNFSVQAFNGHGFSIMIDTLVCDWFAGYSANRFPDTLSLTSDQDGGYYYCDVLMRDSAYTFGRWDIRKDRETKRLDLTILQNIEELKIHFVFPWAAIDTLYCRWESIDPVNPKTLVTLANLPSNATVSMDRVALYRVSDQGELALELNGLDEFVLTVVEIPNSIEIVGAYPNPFNAELTVLISSNQVRSSTVDIYNLLGQRVSSVPVQLYYAMNKIKLPVFDLPSGPYWIRSDNSAPIRVVLIR